MLQTEGRFIWLLVPKAGEQLDGVASVEAIEQAVAVVRQGIFALNKAILAERKTRRANLPYRETTDITAASAALKGAGRGLTAALFGDQAKAVSTALLHPGKALLAFAASLKRREWPVEFCLLDGSGDDGSESEFFLGERCATARGNFTANQNVPVDPDDGAPAVTRRPVSVGYAEGRELESSCAHYRMATAGSKEEVHALRSLVSLSTIAFLQELPAQWGPESIKSFDRWFGGSHDVLHFNCHTIEETSEQTAANDDGAHVEYPDSRVTKIRLRDEANVGAKELNEVVRRSSIANGALVFLNTCSGLTSDGVAPSVADAFLRLEAQAVACTIGPVDDGFATEFAREFYAAYVRSGVSVAEAVKSARQSLGQRYMHPLANLYTVVGRPDFSLRRVGMSAR